MKLAKVATVFGIIGALAAGAAAWGFNIDRPVWKRADLDPLVARVDLLMADKNSDDYFYATRQLERIEARIDRLVRVGKAITAEDHRQLNYWRKQVLRLGSKLKLNK